MSSLSPSPLDAERSAHGGIEQRRPVLERLQAESGQEEHRAEKAHPALGQIVGQPLEERADGGHDAADYRDGEADLQAEDEPRPTLLR